MAAKPRDPMDNIERQRQQLEENVAKLRQALSQWQTWEFEYEMLKEEIQAAPSPKSSDIMELGRGLNAKLVTEKEVKELIGKDGQPPRTANQVIDMISRRVDYVQQNLATVEKQLDAAEKKLDATSVLLGVGMENEEGLPLMEIEEKLDDDGNVVSSEVVQPGKSAPEVAEMLRKVGIQKAEWDKKKQIDSNISEEAAKSAKLEDVKPSEPAKGPSREDKAAAATAERPKKSVSFADDTGASPAQTEPPSARPLPRKKSVSFSDDTKADPSAEPISSLQENGYNENLTDYNWSTGTKVIELDDDGTEIASYPIIPQGESPEDAALRRQMLQYGLSEVGQVVAEIDLERPGQDYSDDDFEDEYDESYDSEAEEEEDEYGRSTRQEISSNYREQMLDLEKKLNARMLENLGPKPDDDTLAEYSDDIRTLKVRKDDDYDKSADQSAPSTSSTNASEPKKKGVRFADNLDISPDPAPTVAPSAIQVPHTSTKTISDTIVERPTAQPLPPNAHPGKQSKVSRFKSSRSAMNQPGDKILASPAVAEPQAVPTGPAGRPLANTVIEHDVGASEHKAPDEFDPVIVNREIQAQYHTMRNKMIQQQGGFTPSQEDIDHPLVEEKDGKTKKVSRFMAARLKANGM